MEKEINDEFILNYFYVTPESTKINGHKSQNVSADIQEYLDNRFPDAESNKEVIMRIKYGPIEERPKCPICGKPVRWYGHSSKRLFFNTCCHEHEVIIRKQNIKKAVKEKYNVDNVFQLEYVKEKSKQTSKEQFGTEYPMQSEVVKNKFVQTSLIRYGVRNSGGSKEAIEKINNTKLEHFGSFEKLYEHNFKKSQETKLIKYGNKNYNNIEKNRETCILHYGATSFLGSEERKQRQQEFKEKIYKKRCEDGIYYDSIDELKIHHILLNFFKADDIICQYKNLDLYPFNCDFYIKSLDLYIEYQGNWTHHTHAYNPNCIEDQQYLEFLVSKTVKGKKNYYDNVINVWTISDPHKRQVAKQNSLNYIEFWSIIEIKEYFEQHESKRENN